MDHIQSGYRGLSLLIDLNLDRFLFAGAIGLALTSAVVIVNMFV
ncbi:hypothetical protein O2N63_12370 [Aliiroseovarius sp. KMU-50]|uniref:Uncharacterized protein n=1 Tax=Aliiroseovarius salicola TaxID=3009082 RepID=A0ABT4W305_9RHOB|nr:hypothetical protein [Aliiroseovarius sp. KMU-50]MDA5094880.1 hypothetical protein [Aliiroseovarius sp. KMU-50]